jgi:hypothetical protein
VNPYLFEAASLFAICAFELTFAPGGSFEFRGIRSENPMTFVGTFVFQKIECRGFVWTTRFQISVSPPPSF